MAKPILTVSWMDLKISNRCHFFPLLPSKNVPLSDPVPKCVLLHNGPPSNLEAWMPAQSHLSRFCGLTDFIWSSV